MCAKQNKTTGPHIRKPQKEKKSIKQKQIRANKTNKLWEQILIPRDLADPIKSQQPYFWRRGFHSGVKT